jgi:hypothetical protein
MDSKRRELLAAADATRPAKTDSAAAIERRCAVTFVPLSLSQEQLLRREKKSGGLLEELLSVVALLHSPLSLVRLL